MSQDVSSTLLYICAVYKQKYAVRIRNAKKVRHCLRAAARCTGGHMPGAPLPGLPRQGKERQAVRATSPRQPRSSAAALCSRHGQAAPLSPPGHASAAPDGPGAAPCAGVAWTAGALVRVGGRHCAGRETTPARAWGRWCAVKAAWKNVRKHLRRYRSPMSPWS